MKFGSVEDPTQVDLSLPNDHPDTEVVLSQKGGKGLNEIFVGCSKWNSKDLKGFYPKGVDDELKYYSDHFNCLELNATFYKSYKPPQIQEWLDRVNPDFKFFPKIHQAISHFKRLKEIDESLDWYCTNTRTFGNQLGMIFLQLHDNFTSKYKDRIEYFLDLWPHDLPLGIELRHRSWYEDSETIDWIGHTLEEKQVSHIITDTPGRRDIVHMRLTSPAAFIRYVGANHESDYARLDDWVDRVEKWKSQGLEKLYFFVHQNMERASPLLSAYFIEKLNQRLGTDLKVPLIAD